MVRKQFMGKIYINGRFLTQNMTGVNRYAYEMCLALAALKVDFQIIAPKRILDKYDVSAFKMIYWGKGKSHFWEQIILPFFFLFKKNYLLLNFSGLGCLLLKNQFMTIHDLSFWLHPEWFSKLYYFYYRFFTPIVAQRALHIITVSNCSKNEIIECLKLPENKISVIYNAVSERFTQKKIEKKDFRYILAVSSIEPRKNFTTLLAAFSLLKQDVKLVVVGVKNAVFQQVELTKNDNVIYLSKISDEELFSYYANAALFVYPSVYEGFGIPPLEAIAAGCPAAVSDIPVFHEVFEECVYYFNPYDVNDMKSIIEDLLDNKTIRNNFTEKQEKLLQKYSWEISAKNLINCIEKHTSL